MAERHGAVLIIGGGIGGIQAALDVAEAGFTAYLVEKGPSIGGKMAMLDKTFPTNDCSICIESPKMLDILANKNIHLMAYSEVKEVQGSAGHFRVKVTTKPRYVLADCTACGKCEEVCIVKADSEFDQGMARRKAIFLSFPYAVPRVYTLDMENCRKYGGGCRACVVACRDEAGHNLIDFWQRPRTVDLEVGSIIVATGLEMVDPSVVTEYGYLRHKNVITALQCERLLNAAGPTAGCLCRPSDGWEPRTVAYIQCVGSRDRRGRQYCSKVCCMYATKQAVLIKEHCPDTQVYIFYLDRRFYGKGHGDLYRKAEEMGVHYIRSRPGRIQELPSGHLRLRYEDSETGELKELVADMVVLSVALRPSSGNPSLAQVLGLPLNDDGFFREPDPLFQPLESAAEGIFLCGWARKPSDITETVTQASAAAAKAVMTIIGSKLEVPS